MKLPRDIGGEELAKLLSRYGYEITRQTGNHFRLTTTLKGEHHPDHSQTQAAEGGYPKRHLG